MERDYLTTIDSLSKVNNCSFWVEEICYVLDGKRDMQVFQLGNSSEYFKDLLKRSNSPNFQSKLLVEAIQLCIQNFPFDEFIYSIEEDNSYKMAVTYIGLARTFCSKNFLIVRLITDFFLKLCNTYLKPNKDVFFRSRQFANLYSNIRYLIEDFVVNDLEYEQISHKLFNDYNFLSQYFRTTEHFLNFGGNLFMDTMLHLNKFKYPLNISKDAANMIVENSDLLDSLIVEFKKDQATYGSVLQQIFLLEINPDNILKKLEEFQVPKQDYESYTDKTIIQMKELSARLAGSKGVIKGKVLILKQESIN